MMLSINHLWSHVFKRTAKSLALPSWLFFAVWIFSSFAFICPAKVAYFQNVVFCDEQVFRLEISMYKSIFMQEVHASKCLNEEIEGSFFRKTPFLLNQSEKIAFWHVLHHQIDIHIIFEVSIHTHNINMLQPLVNFDLSLQSFLHLGCCYHTPVHRFNGNFYSTWLVHSQFYLTICAFS